MREAWPLIPGLGVLAADPVGVAVPVGFDVAIAGGRAPAGFAAFEGTAVVVGGLASGGAVGCRFGRTGFAICAGAGGRVAAPGRGGGGLAAFGVEEAVTVGCPDGAGLDRGELAALVAGTGIAGLMDGGSVKNGLGRLFALYHASIAGLRSRRS